MANTECSSFRLHYLLLVVLVTIIRTLMLKAEIRGACHFNHCVRNVKKLQNNEAIPCDWDPNSLGPFCYLRSVFGNRAYGKKLKNVF